MMDLAAEYNNRALVPDHPVHIARWAAEARAYRETAEAELDLAYGARPRNRVDVFHGKAQGRADGGAAPMVLFIHGGYWRSLDKSSFSHVAGPANALGLDVAVAGYTLCPEVTISDIIDEMRQCCLYLSQRYGRRIVLAGHSAGGHLAACMAATDWALLGARPDLIQAGLSISGLFDLRPLMATPMNDDLRLTTVEAITASPLFWPVPAPVPFDSWVGGKESFEFLRQARSLPAAWQGLGLRSSYVVANGEDHFTIGDLLSRPDHPMTRRLMELAGR